MHLLVSASTLCLLLLLSFSAQSQTARSGPPLRVAIAGLVHGHVSGWLEQYQHHRDLQIVAIAEPRQELAAQYAHRFGLERNIFYSDLENMLQSTHPDAVLAYSNTYDHRRVVEICARHGVHVMMEKPLAVSIEDARAIEKASRDGKIQVLVNYETSWYRSNHAAYDIAHDNSIGKPRKVVVHDGHRGPKEIGVEPEFLSWLTDPKLNGAGALFDFGCYGADLMTWLMDGRRPDTITAITQQIKPDLYPLVDDEATIILTYPKAQAIIQASWNWPFDRKDMEIYGENGYVMTLRRDNVLVRRQQGEETLAATPIAAPYDDPVSELRAVIREGAKPDGLTSLETNVVVTEILENARRSAATGTTIHITSRR